MIEIQMKTLIAQMVNFSILIFFLNKFLFSKLGAFLDKRSHSIKNSLDEIEKDRADIARLREEYQERVTQLDKENYQKMQEAIQKGQEAASQLLAKADGEAKQMLDTAREEVVREKEKALREVRSEIGSLAIEIAGKIIGESYNGKLQKKLVAEFVDKLGKEGGLQ